MSIRNTIKPEIIDQLDLFDLIIEYEDIVTEFNAKSTQGVKDKMDAFAKMLDLVYKLDNLLILAEELKNAITDVYIKYS